ncbi:ATP-binding protein [Nocardioides furvisabuli]|uniref:ATP-binding protein n=1 Tax=Nocardioides furvisabuli TaxID=375542 RepID=UPI001E4A7303|nr:helix-turn-helix transcriptional regulator [Nocardioides furvisabuli]
MFETASLRPATAPVRGATAFVGRRAEVERLEAVWTAVGDDRRQLVFVGGEPGVGKTRLVAEAAAALREHGCTVLWGSCHQDLDIPYRPFVAILEQALEHLAPEDLAAIPRAAASPLRRLTTSASRHWPGPDDGPGGDRESRPVLFDAVLRVLLALADRGPLVLVLEDLHWAQEPTLALLSHLAESTAGEKLLVLVTRRTTAPDRTDAVTYALADLHRLDGVERIDLTGLSTEDVAEYLIRQGGVSAAAARAAAPVLRDQTGGNPFFLQEYWYDLETRGGLAAMRSGTAQAPRSVQDALDRRLTAFSADHAGVIELAAVAGDVVDLSVLVAAGELDSSVVLAGVDFGARAGLLAADADGTGHRFAHALARQAVLGRMSSTARAAAHLRVAEVLEERLSEDDPALVAQLAHHYVQASPLGHEEKAAHYLVLAAQQAVRTLAPGEAAVLYERAAQLHTTQGPPRAELLLTAARCYMHAGDFTTARRLYAELGSSTSPRTRLLAAIGHEDASARPGVNGQSALRMLGAALEGAALERGDPLYVRAMASMGRASAFTGDTGRAREWGEDALALARADGDEELLAHALGRALWQGMTPQLAPVLLARAVELQEIGSRLSDDDHLGPAAFYRSVFAYMVGDHAAWTSAQRDLTDLALSRGQPFFRYVAGCSRYAHRYAVGDYAAAERIVAWLAQFNQEFDGATEGSWGVQQFMLRRVTGGLEEVRRFITGDEQLDGYWLPGLLALYTELEMWPSAARLLSHLCGRIDDHRTGAQWGGVLAFMTEAAVRLDDAPTARLLRPLVATHAGGNLMAGQFVGVFGSADRRLAQLDSVLGAPSADVHFERALAMDRQMGAVTHQAETLAAWARHRARAPATSAGPSAAGLADEAGALARRIGHRGVLRDLDAVPAPEAVHPPLPNGLTEREVDVLRLVGEGLSNREIGERLFLSANTAANHVRSILLKTGAPNRTKAAVFATEHGLLRSGG